MTTTPSPGRKQAGAKLTTLGAMWPRMVALRSRIDHEVEQALQRQLHLGFSEFVALMSLADRPDGELRMQELADATSLNQSSATRLVGRLERTGLTERRLCEYDRRGVYTGITDAGRVTLRKAVPVYEAALANAFDRVAADPDYRDLIAAVDPR
ncbi:MarR family winged helix-turn-helix transcriptional regulator [Amycolatopsis dendrobii]|uniref:MarR family transcriptional regulator n=1 Tax=Amycolatopsis dendrobii TaxID=2760662 RepID=A0A7W3VXT1_9PSEU|nr:MarR family transcriptional regulator [Amycolatopsis dendrobii]MBB1155214.1 MarR family transcriptional regulator [Amycolatopsis dendrobii]